MTRLLFILFFIFFPTLLYAEDSMMKIVYRHVGSNVIPGSFAATPLTLYRWGSTKLRAEEMPDPSMRLHGLIITNEKDIWMINLWNKTGKHAIDPGPTYNSHSPIIPPEPGRIPRASKFEFGKELLFMKDKGVKPKIELVKNENFLVYECEEEGLLIRLYVSPKTKQPVSVSVTEGANVLTQLEYDEYQPSLSPDASLFSPPKGIIFSEEK